MGAFAGGGKRVLNDDFDLLNEAIDDNELTGRQYVLFY
jgi:hypothetical protein